MALRALALSCLGVGLAAAQNHWAVLIAGSNGYYNYRHQADICHAYHLLMQDGFHPDKVITFLFDDVANSKENPLKGQLFNKPYKSLNEAVDVYAGCKKDYTGRDVTPEKFLAVLTGDEKTAGGKVLKSTAEDHVFVNFVDHGGVGIIAFPDMQKVLHAKDLSAAIATMHTKGMYKQLTFYLETCESGSMFEGGLLSKDLPVYAMTAANGKESSWGTYCGDEAKVAGKSLNTCLGDLFEVNWMGNTEKVGMQETLKDQYAATKIATNRSHVMQYGAFQAFGPEHLVDFLGPGGESLKAPGKAVVEEAEGSALAVDARDVKLHFLYEEYKRTGTHEASDRLVEEIRERQEIKALGESIAAEAVGSKTLSASWEEAGEVDWTHVDCHEQAVTYFGARCGWSEGRLVLSKVLYSLCNRTSGKTAPIFAALDKFCPRKSTAVWT